MHGALVLDICPPHERRCEKNAGHLGASLGVVELTVALHYVFNTPDDKVLTPNCILRAMLYLSWTFLVLI